MNCPNCGFSLDPNFTGPCPRCGQPITGSVPANSGGYGMGMDAFSQSPTILSSGPASPNANSPTNESFGLPYPNQSNPNENYGLAYPSQSAPSSAPSAWPGQPSGYNAPGTLPPYASGGFAPQPPAPLPPRKSRSSLIIGLLLVVVVLLASGLGIALYALNTHHQQGLAGAGATATSSLTTPTPTATPGRTILFQDPLTSNTYDWANDSHCFFQNKSYHVRDAYVCYAPAGNIVDATISVDAFQVSGSLIWFYGLLFRRVSTGNFYVFVIDGNSQWKFSNL